MQPIKLFSKFSNRNKLFQQIQHLFELEHFLQSLGHVKHIKLLRSSTEFVGQGFTQVFSVVRYNPVQHPKHPFSFKLKHLEQVEKQSIQTKDIKSVKYPNIGHSVTHSPFQKNKLGLQIKQLLYSGPEHD